MLSLLIWVSGCSSTGSTNKKPDGAKTTPMEIEERDKDDTPRSLIIKFDFNIFQMKDGNNRFKSIRE